MPNTQSLVCETEPSNSIIVPGEKEKTAINICMTFSHIIIIILQEGSVGMVYLFSTALEPSFKMMLDTSPAISKLSKSSIKKYAG